jgi:23S rRNA pseudouridine1911/1915/1917 synthase
MTLLEALMQLHPRTPKKRAKQWIQAGRVAVNGVIVKHPRQALPESACTVELLDRRSALLDCGSTGWPIHPRVTLLHLDQTLAVVNKAPGVLAVSALPDDLSAQSILADFLAGKLRSARPLPAAYRKLRPLPVHRIDQYTSGVFCLAMNPEARAHLIAQLRAHSMQREYIAFVEGRLPAKRGTWRNWLKLSGDGLRQVIVPSPESAAQEAITHYEVIAEYGPATKLRLRLETGRKHQIRAQAAHAGAPLVGDRIYNARRRLDFPRQALHAEVLTLEHPAKPGSQQKWTAELPEDLTKLETRLRTL